jgi:hypothetical protein
VEINFYGVFAMKRRIVLLAVLVAMAATFAIEIYAEPLEAIRCPTNCGGGGSGTIRLGEGDCPPCKG